MELIFTQGQSQRQQVWKRQYITQYLAFVNALFGSIIVIARALISSYQGFVSEKSMLKKLYGEKVDLQVQVDEAPFSDQKDSKSVQDEFKETLEKRKEFQVQYCCFTLTSLFKTLCCCFVGPCTKSKWRCWFQRQLDQHTKLLIS